MIREKYQKYLQQLTEVLSSINFYTLGVFRMTLED